MNLHAWSCWDWQTSLWTPIMNCRHCQSNHETSNWLLNRVSLYLSLLVSLELSLASLALLADNRLTAAADYTRLQSITHGSAKSSRSLPWLMVRLAEDRFWNFNRSKHHYWDQSSSLGWHQSNWHLNHQWHWWLWSEDALSTVSQAKNNAAMTVML